MLGIKEEFEIVAVGFGPSKLCKAKAVTDENDSFVKSRRRLT